MLSPFVEFFYSDLVFTISFLLVYLLFYTYHLNYKFKKLFETNNTRVINYKTHQNPNFTYLYTYILILVLLLYKKFYTSNHYIFNGHLTISEFNYSITFLINSALVVFFFINKFYFKFKNSESILTIFLFSYTLQILLLSSNVFTFLVVLEFQSLSLLYYLLINNNYTKKEFFKKNETQSYVNDYAQQYTYSIIFNYWMSFFGSLLTVFGLISIEKIYGFVEWGNINILANTHSLLNNNHNFLINIIFWSPLFLGFLIKLGYAPAYLWKPEFYRGLEYETLFFFMTFYFFLFFILFNFIFFGQLNHLGGVWISYTVLATIITAVGVIFAIFDLTSLKSFLGYGTIMHTTFMLTSLNLSV